MDAIGQVLQNSALLETSRHLQRRLSDADSTVLLVLLGRLTKRYPAQDLAESQEEYLADFEKLAVKYSLPRLEAAIEALRIDPDQVFFPRPDEAAKELERMANAEARERAKRESEALRVEMERTFWEHVEWRMEREGLTEQQVLDTIKTPGYVGRRARVR